MKINCGDANPNGNVEFTYKGGCKKALKIKDAYRCVGCGGYFHKECILEHFELEKAHDIGRNKLKEKVINLLKNFFNDGIFAITPDSSKQLIKIIKKTMKKTILGILSIGIALLLLIIFIPIKPINKINYVSGNQHIYKGQVLDPKWAISIAELSPRASWLNSSQYVDVKIKDILEQMILDAEQEGICLVVTSGYRNPEKQQLLYNSIKDKTRVALPYESEHQTGLAVDFAACPMKNGIRDDSIQRLELKKDFEELPEYCWLVRNAYKYGFEQSFTEANKNIMGYSSEPWHFKFIIN